jgi:hypothetical protein
LDVVESNTWQKTKSSGIIGGNGMVGKEDFCGIFYQEVSECYPEKEIIGKLGLDDHKKVVDAYGHHKSCKWFVFEDKNSKRGVKDAIEKAESTIEQLKQKGRNVDMVIIRIQGIGKRERELFKRDGYRLIDGKKHKPTQVYIKNIPCYIIYYKEWEEAKVKYFFSAITS